MNKPNFLVVGAAKCGTTSLDRYLKQHPDVFLPEIKECRYFSDLLDKNINPFTKKEHVKIVSNPKDYYGLFKNANVKAIGDISPDYLYYYKESIKKIKKELGNDIKIIIILRDPVQRSYSNYLHMLREGFDKFTFQEIIEQEEQWKKENIWYGFYVTGPGFYFNSTKAYLDNFENVKILIFEEFIKNTQKYLKDICEFLNIDSHFVFNEPLFKNKTGIPKNKLLNSFIKKQFPFKKIMKRTLIFLLGQKYFEKKLLMISENNLQKPKMDEDIKSSLKNLYKDDIEKLEKLLKKDLSIWKN